MTGSLTECALGAIVVLIILAVIAGAVGPLIQPYMDEIAAKIQAGGSAATLDFTFKANEHAQLHVEAISIEECLNSKGPYQVWRDKFNKETFYALCEFRQGVWGLAVCSVKGFNKTMFSPKDGSWKKVMDYLTERAARYILGMPNDCK